MHFRYEHKAFKRFHHLQLGRGKKETHKGTKINQIVTRLPKKEKSEEKKDESKQDI